MINKNFNLGLWSLVLLFSNFCYAQTPPQTTNSLRHPLYIGAIGGFGSTTWEGLVPSQMNQNLALNMSTPIRTQEGGQVWGVMAGYEFTPFFAVEANYMHYPQATVVFDTFSLFSFNHEGLEGFNTNTEAFSFMGKVMLVVPDTRMRVYSSAGIANVHREDIIINDWRLSPSFGVGLNFQISDHVMGELGGNYTAGYGESQLNPADAYYPFLYSVSVRLAYRF